MTVGGSQHTVDIGHKSTVWWQRLFRDEILEILELVVHSEVRAFPLTVPVVDPLHCILTAECADVLRRLLACSETRARSRTVAARKLWRPCCCFAPRHEVEELPLHAVKACSLGNVWCSSYPATWAALPAAAVAVAVAPGQRVVGSSLPCRALLTRVMRMKMKTRTRMRVVTTMMKPPTKMPQAMAKMPARLVLTKAPQQVPRQPTTMHLRPRQATTMAMAMAMLPLTLTLMRMRMLMRVRMLMIKLPATQMLNLQRLMTTPAMTATMLTMTMLTMLTPPPTMVPMLMTLLMAPQRLVPVLALVLVLVQRLRQRLHRHEPQLPLRMTTSRRSRQHPRPSWLPTTLLAWPSTLRIFCICACWGGPVSANTWRARACCRCSCWRCCKRNRPRLAPRYAIVVG